MDESFIEELDKSTMVIINNIMIYSETEEDPEKYFRVVLDKLRWNQSYAKLEKWEFWS